MWPFNKITPPCIYANRTHWDPQLPQGKPIPEIACIKAITMEATVILFLLYMHYNMTNMNSLYMLLSSVVILVFLIIFWNSIGCNKHNTPFFSLFTTRTHKFTFFNSPSFVNWAACPIEKIQGENGPISFFMSGSFQSLSLSMEVSKSLNILKEKYLQSLLNYKCYAYA